MIEVKNITKILDNKLILRDVDATFRPGKINLTIGGSGAGKTVLLKCMAGLFNIDQGVISYDGRDYSSLNKTEKKSMRKEIGMLFQNAALFDSMTVQDNVAFPIRMFGDKEEDEISDKVNSCLAKVNLVNANKIYPAELSGGMKKRVGIARAISMDPKYLFCDEPNSGLDPMTARVIDDLIKNITEELNITTIVNTHDMNSVMRIGDYIIFIHEGRKWWEGGRDEILQSDNKELREFVFASDFTHDAN